MVLWVKDLACLCGSRGLIPGLVQCVNDLEFLNLWHRSQLWLGFSLWPENFHMLRMLLKKNKKMVGVVILAFFSILEEMLSTFHH